jgi:phage terminase small subunit
MKKENGLQFWEKVLSEYELSEAHDLARLRMACSCLDDIKEAEKQITKDGRFITDRYGQIKEHTALKSIRDNRIIFCRIIRELALDINVPETRPPRQY